MLFAVVVCWVLLALLAVRCSWLLSVVVCLICVVVAVCLMVDGRGGGGFLLLLCAGVC